MQRFFDIACLYRRDAFTYIFLSLCVSDVISALLSPLYLYRRTWGFYNWKASTFMCKVSWF